MLEARETRKRKYTPQALEALGQRAKQIRELDTIEAQARFAYDLEIEFLSCGVLGKDFSKWLARWSGFTRRTCQARQRLGVYLAVNGKLYGTPKEAVKEQKRLERTPRPDLRLTWDD